MYKEKMKERKINKKSHITLNTSNNKGITLVALIITIIVLLILAVVAIRAVQGDGIINHAKNAQIKYEDARADEQEKLSGYELLLAQETGNAWKQEGTKVTKGDVTLEVGKTVTNYTAGGKTWKVLGAENGNLLLMASKNLTNSYTLTGSTGGWSTEEYRFVAAEKALDDYCKTTIPDIGEATKIRSVKVEDINRVTGYKPENTGEGKPYGSKNVYQYGNEVTYSLKSGKVAYASDVKSSDTSSYSSFTHPDGRKLGENGVESIPVKSNSYYYYPYSLTTSSSTTGDLKGIATNSDAYSLLFANTDYSNGAYWLASSYVITREGYAYFGVRDVRGGSVGISSLWGSGRGSSSGSGYGVRPVVVLESEFQPVV